MKIVVVGGSGLVGAKLVSNLRHRGHEVVPASRRSGVDTLTREGLAEALAGAEVVVDVTNSASYHDPEVTQFFRCSSRNLIEAARAARVKHHMVLSIVGTDRLLQSSYFRAKMIQEDLVSSSPIPHTILRSTQFYEFMPRIPESDADERTVRASPALVQPLASGEVAAALADLATTAPRNRMIEFAGPECFRLDEIVQRVMHAYQDRREVVTDTHARYFGALLAEDTLTPDEGAIIGVGTFEDWLKHSAARATQSRSSELSAMSV
ncbi:SDR family oxidoreductase [Steroidobacter sp. S1-65]|uniref:SDR family oxidoreductase n=1 Tax=Steroidobacter gossypii TaxID=2805490 RepID=A0ABS1WUT1_9GAMM|nr:NAD(P)H-binding protein [Steroidobacter gossypii]MBM0104734.1 SDR family oxidoreductase [Steroidobacter gossypii]